MPTKDELIANLEQTTTAYETIARAEWDRRKALEAELCKTLQAEFGEELSLTKTAQNEAKKALDDFLDNERREKTLNNLPYPEGTVLIEWNKPNWTWSPDRKPTPTKNKGVIQIFKAGDPCRMKYNPPQPGSMVVRRLKKDGTPSVDLVPVYANTLKWWLPEGQEPESNRQTTA